MTDYQSLSNEALIEHILTRYHAVHRTQLELLSTLAQRVEADHYNHKLCPKGLNKHLTTLRAELEEHMQKEETILFPMILREYSPMIKGPINVMKQDHEHHQKDIDSIKVITNNMALHDGASATWTALYVGLNTFVADLNQHIHIENEILFARALANSN